MRSRSASQKSGPWKRIRKEKPKSEIPEPEIASSSENLKEEVCEESNLVGAGTSMSLEKFISVKEEAQNIAEVVEVVRAAPVAVEEDFKDCPDSEVEQVNEIKSNLNFQSEVIPDKVEEDKDMKEADEEEEEAEEEEEEEGEEEYEIEEEDEIEEEEEEYNDEEEVDEEEEEEMNDASFFTGDKIDMVKVLHASEVKEANAGCYEGRGLDGDESNDKKETTMLEGKINDNKEHGAVVSGTVHNDDSTYEKNAGDTFNAGKDEKKIVANFHRPLSERTGEELEIVVRGLNTKTTKEELSDVFSANGSLLSVNLVVSQSNRKFQGIAFIRYTNDEDARRVLTELKDVIEIRGKRVVLSAGSDNDTLYLGNVSKTWTKSQVLETLSALGINDVVELRLLDDPKHDGKNKGYAFLKFASYSNAVQAFRLLTKPEALFGSNLSAKVDFAQLPIQCNDDALSTVKTIFIEHIPPSWDESHVKDLYKQYGEIEKVRLSRDFSIKRKKNFGFIDFVSRENALACLKGINEAHVAEGEFKVSASLARTQNKARFAKKGSQDGVKETEVQKEASESKVDAKKTKREKEKGKSVKIEENVKGSKQSKFVSKATDTKNIRASRGRKRERRNMDNDLGRRTRQVRNHEYPGFPPGSHSHSYAGAYANRSSDLEPHAGYLPTVKPNEALHGYGQIRPFQIPIGYQSMIHPSGGGYRGVMNTMRGEFEHHPFYPPQSNYNNYREYQPGHMFPGQQYPYHRQYY